VRRLSGPSQESGGGVVEYFSFDPSLGASTGNSLAVAAAIERASPLIAASLGSLPTLPEILDVATASVQGDLVGCNLLECVLLLRIES
jgi:hypothetical protein